MNDILTTLFDEFDKGLTNVERRFGSVVETLSEPEPTTNLSKGDESENSGNESGKIAALNDRFRQSYPTPNDDIKGEWLFDEDITKLGSRVEANIGRKIAQVGDDGGFEGCALYDRGSFDHSNRHVIWLIKTYTDDSMQTEATDPSDPESSFRVMLVSLADENQ